MPTIMSKKQPRKDRHLPNKTVRIPEDLYDRLRALAEKTDRPLAREIRRALEAHLKANEEAGE